MENNQIKVRGYDISVANKTANVYLISNFWFELIPGKTMGISINDNIEKDGFLSIFDHNKHNKNIFSGVIDINGNIINLSNDDISKYSKFYSMSLFNQVDGNTRILEIIEKMIAKIKYEEISKIIEKNNCIEDYLRIYKIFKYEEIKKAHLKSSIDIIKKYIKKIIELNETFETIDINEENLRKISNNCLTTHIEYIKKRINLQIENNILFKEIYETGFDSTILSKTNPVIFQNLDQLIIDIEMVGSQNKTLAKIKMELLNNFFNKHNESYETKKYHEISKNKNLIVAFIDNLERKIIIYSKIISQSKKGTSDYWIFTKRKIVCLKMIKIIENEMNNLINLSKNDAFGLYHELNNLFKTASSIKEFSINFKDIEYKKMKKYIEEFIDNEFSLLIKKYKNISLHTITDLNLSLEKFGSIKNSKNDNIGTIIDSIRIEAKNLLDEINWEKKKLTLNLNKKSIELRKETNDIKKKYEELKNQYNHQIKKFLDRKKTLVNDQVNLNEEENKTLSENFFKTEVAKYETIYNFVSSDQKTFKNMLSKNSSTNGLLTLVKYRILYVAKKIDLSIFDLLKRVKNLDIFEKKSILLLIASFDKKDLIVLNNFYSDIETGENIKKLSKTFNRIKKRSKKTWFLVEEFIYKALNSLDYISIIDSSKVVEFGTVKEMCSNPIYDITMVAVNKTPTGERGITTNFKKIFDFDLKHDDYKINDNHFVFGEADNIYNWTNKIPQMTPMTTSIDLLNSLINKIEFNKIRKIENKKPSIHKTQPTPIVHKTIDIYLDDSEEFLIIDVEK